MENKLPITVVPMEERHIDEVALLEEMIFSVPFKKKDICDLFQNPSWRFFTALDGDKVVGYIKRLRPPRIQRQGHRRYARRPRS